MIVVSSCCNHPKFNTTEHYRHPSHPSRGYIYSKWNRSTLLLGHNAFSPEFDLMVRNSLAA